jgi:hypothetical protein
VGIGGADADALYGGVSDDEAIAVVHQALKRVFASLLASLPYPLIILPHHTLSCRESTL